MEPGIRITQQIVLRLFRAFFVNLRQDKQIFILRPGSQIFTASVPLQRPFPIVILRGCRVITSFCKRIRPVICLVVPTSKTVNTSVQAILPVLAEVFRIQPQLLRIRVVGINVQVMLFKPDGRVLSLLKPISVLAIIGSVKLISFRLFIRPIQLFIGSARLFIGSGQEILFGAGDPFFFLCKNCLRAFFRICQLRLLLRVLLRHREQFLSRFSEKFLSRFSEKFLCRFLGKLLCWFRGIVLFRFCEKVLFRYHNQFILSRNDFFQFRKHDFLLPTFFQKCCFLLFRYSAGYLGERRFCSRTVRIRVFR